MHMHTAQVVWNRGSQAFIDGRYSRCHSILLDGGLVIPGSSSPFVVPEPLSDPAGLDPEEAFVASLSGCHMLWFLSIAAACEFCVDSYSDRAEGVMSRNATGKLFVSVVTLRPQVIFSPLRKPTEAEFPDMHHRAHEECFIANSVMTEVRCEPFRM